MTNSSNGGQNSTLPRLLYVGDVPVESTYHGSALLFRLLQTYPANRLIVVEAGLNESQPARRLPGVQYASALQPGRRWLNTRFHGLVSSLFTLHAPYRARAIQQTLREFQPEVVLTVAHGYSWIAAARYARVHDLPLHLIVHDDWPRMARLVGRMNQVLDRKFGRIYRLASSRLCVSPYMVEEYQHRYAADGSVLYPSRAADTVVYAVPPEAVPNRPLTIAFGGTINTGGHVKALRMLADELARIGGQLRLYGPITEEQAQRDGLRLPNVKLCGLVPAEHFIERIRGEADVLFVPMSFATQDRANMRLCFPSKLTDYTAAGLPLLIHGPTDSSAVRWARSNPGVAEVISSETPADYQITINRLSDINFRCQLTLKAHEVGLQYFSNRAVGRVFLNLISPSGNEN